MASTNSSSVKNRQAQQHISTIQDWNDAHANQIDNHSSHPAQSSTTATSQQARGAQPNKSQKMPKAQAMTLVARLKQTTLVASIMAFGLFGALIAPQIQATATKSTTTTQKTTPTSTATQTPATSSGSFFNQAQTGDYSIGSGTSSSSTSTATSNNTANSSSTSTSTPGTGTHVS